VQLQSFSHRLLSIAQVALLYTRSVAPGPSGVSVQDSPDALCKVKHNIFLLYLYFLYQWVTDANVLGCQDYDASKPGSSGVVVVPVIWGTLI
jgi:hypothetical protein